MAGEQDIIRFYEKRDFFEAGLTRVYRDEITLLQQSYKQWLMEETADKFYKSDMSHSGLGVMGEKPIGQDAPRDRIKYGIKKTFTMKTYGLSLVIQYEVVRWDLYSVYNKVAKELAKTAMTRYDLEAYAILNNAFSTADAIYTDYQGQAICSTAHTRMDAGTWKNRPTQDKGLSMAMLQVADNDLRKTVNERGIFINLNPRLLITTVENNWLAQTLLQSQYNPENANQQKNVASGMGLKLLTTPYITTSTYWFIACDKSDYEMRMALGDMPDLVKDSEPASRNSIWNSYCSFRVEVYRARGLYGSTGV